MVIGDWLSEWVIRRGRDRDRAIAHRSIVHPVARSPIARSSLVLLLAALPAACSQQSYANDDPSKIRVGIVFDIGGKDDRSFNAAAWKGVHCAESGTWPDGTSCGKPALGVVV